MNLLAMRRPCPRPLASRLAPGLGLAALLLSCHPASDRTPPFTRAGATRDLLCDLERASRDADGASGACSCDTVPRSGRCGHVAIGDDRRRALLLDAPTELDLSLDGGTSRKLRFSVGVPGRDGGASRKPRRSVGDSGSEGGAIDLQVSARDGEGAVVGEWRGSVRPGAAWHDVALDLEKPVRRLTVRVASPEDGGKPASLALALPRLVEPTTAATQPTNVVVYLMDTLRADHTSAYGYARDTTPRLAELARNGVRFDRAYSTAARTRPAAASLLTGLHPGFHGAHSGLAMVTDVSTLAERFHAGGWSTWAFITNGQVFGEGLNFEQGFDRFQAIRGPRPRHPARAEEVNELLFPQLDAFADEPFLLYVHTLDPHAPYDPPPGYAGRFTDPAYAGAVRPATTNSESLNRMPVDDRDLAQVVGLYDEDILYQDAMFGRLLERLEQLGVRDRTIIVVVADHGEEFREHGGWSHGGRLFEEQTHVPLLVQVPGVAAFVGRTVPEPVQIVDVMPTLLSWFGIDGVAATQGRDLTPLLLGQPTPAFAERAIYSEETTYTAGAEIKSLRVGQWKMIRVAVSSDLYDANVLFDLAADPGEKRNLGRTERRKLWELNQQLARQETAWAKTFRVARGEPERLDERTREQLEALGYVTR